MELFKLNGCNGVRLRDSSIRELLGKPENPNLDYVTFKTTTVKCDSEEEDVFTTFTVQQPPAFTLGLLGGGQIPAACGDIAPNSWFAERCTIDTTNPYIAINDIRYTGVGFLSGFVEFNFPYTLDAPGAIALKADLELYFTNNGVGGEIVNVTFTGSDFVIELTDPGDPLYALVDNGSTIDLVNFGCFANRGPAIELKWFELISLDPEFSWEYYDIQYNSNTFSNIPIFNNPNPSCCVDCIIDDKVTVNTDDTTDTVDVLIKPFGKPAFVCTFDVSFDVPGGLPITNATTQVNVTFTPQNVFGYDTVDDSPYIEWDGDDVIINSHAFGTTTPPSDPSTITDGFYYVSITPTYNGSPATTETESVYMDCNIKCEVATTIIENQDNLELSSELNNLMNAIQWSVECNNLCIANDLYCQLTTILNNLGKCLC